MRLKTRQAKKARRLAMGSEQYAKDRLFNWWFNRPFRKRFVWGKRKLVTVYTHSQPKDRLKQIYKIIRLNEQWKGKPIILNNIYNEEERE